MTHPSARSVLAGLLPLLAILLHGETAPGQATVIFHDNSSRTTFPATDTTPSPANRPPSGSNARTLNDLVLEAVAAMPHDGGYQTSSVANAALHTAVQAGNSQLLLDPSRAMPSFCSGGTYLVFLSVLDRLQRAGRIQIDAPTLNALLVQEHQADGAGIWGRWNANGPGTARLFHEAGLGRNFTSFDEAQPGDFLKVFWNDEIGVREAGHSVVFLGLDHRPEGEFVHFWSSNTPNGFGEKEVPRQRIHRALFSRLEHPDQINRLAALPARDPYLAAMLKRSSTPDEVAQMVGLTGSPATWAASKSPSVPQTTGAAASNPTPANGPARKPSWLSRMFHPHHDPTPSPQNSGNPQANTPQ